jgi:hypothetical protein
MNLQIFAPRMLRHAKGLLRILRSAGYVPYTPCPNRHEPREYQSVKTDVGRPRPPKRKIQGV